MIMVGVCAHCRKCVWVWVWMWVYVLNMIGIAIQNRCYVVMSHVPVMLRRVCVCASVHVRASLFPSVPPH